MQLDILGDVDEAVQWKQLHETQLVEIEDSDQENDQQEIEVYIYYYKNTRFSFYMTDTLQTIVQKNYFKEIMRTFKNCR